MQNNIIVSNIEISGAFCIYAASLGNYIFQYLDTTKPGDIPPDIACLSVVSVYNSKNVTYITVNY